MTFLRTLAHRWPTFAAIPIIVGSLYRIDDVRGLAFLALYTYGILPGFFIDASFAEFFHYIRSCRVIRMDKIDIIKPVIA